MEAGSWLTGHLGIDPTAGELAVRDWLAMPQQRLAEVTAGAVFRDDLSDASAEAITDPQLRQLPRIGSVDQWADSTDFLGLQELGQAVTSVLA